MSTPERQQWQRPFYSVGVLYHVGGPDPAFLGTCCAYLNKSHFLTAAHCVRGLDPGDLGITLPLIDHGGFIRPRAIRAHPDADLAVLETPTVEAEELAPYTGPNRLCDWGSPVAALGYPEDAGEDPEEGLFPTARYFTGHIQRLYTHQSNLGPYRYRAGELSFGAPGSLSGGPVFGVTDYRTLVGIVAENRDSVTYLRTIEERLEPGKEFRHVESAVIRYGLFVHVAPLDEWLRAVIS